MYHFYVSLPQGNSFFRRKTNHYYFLTKKMEEFLKKNIIYLLQGFLRGSRDRDKPRRTRFGFYPQTKLPFPKGWIEFYLYRNQVSLNTQEGENWREITFPWSKNSIFFEFREKIVRWGKNLGFFADTIRFSIETLFFIHLK